jgi:hypothetical protein
MSKRIPLRVDFDVATGVYRIFWIVDDEFSPDDSGNGACVGEEGDDPEMTIANVVAEKSESAEKDGSGFLWSSEREARAVLKNVKAAIRIYHDQMANRPWPEWAEKALAAGWKSPKGWHP